MEYSKILTNRTFKRRQIVDFVRPMMDNSVTRPTVPNCDSPSLEMKSMKEESQISEETLRQPVENSSCNEGNLDFIRQAGESILDRYRK
jgi:hypothetical protein